MLNLLPLATVQAGLVQRQADMFTNAPNVVQELIDAANAVHSAAKAMKISKENSLKISKLALEIAMSVETTVAMHYHGEVAVVPVSVTAALGATRDLFTQCSGFMRDAAATGTMLRHLKKISTGENISAFFAAVEGLRVLLKIHEGQCQLILEPFAGLGIDVSCTKDVLEANVTTVDAAYDGLKTTLNAMVNVTDGLVWPLKAAPQTLLYILKLFEDCKGVQATISSLLYDIQATWVVVEGVAKADEQLLLPNISNFFEALQRIAIRLHVILRLGEVKRTLAMQSVIACLELERRRFDAARNHISLAFQGATIVGLDRLAKRIVRLHPELPQVPLTSDMRVSSTLPPRPNVFHGRDDFVGDAVGLLTTTGSVRLAVLGPGGMGKTTVALAIAHDAQVWDYFGSERFFLSCEALPDPDSLIIALGKLFNLPSSTDLLSAVVSHLKTEKRALLVLDNFETLWLADGAPVAAVESLLGILAQIPPLSLMITCRGIIFPQSVQWSNTESAALEPFSLEAAIRTFEDKAGYSLIGTDTENAKELLNAVDRIPLAVSLLGQLARRGNTLSELLARWNREHSGLLATHGRDRANNLEVSIEVSIAVVQAADNSRESLELLSVCSMLPDGLRPEVFERLRSQFKNIDRAKDTLSAYALVAIGADRVLRTLSPIRHLVLERYPLLSKHRDALFSIYFDIADRLPVTMNERFQSLAVAGAPEMANLSSLLFTIIDQPSHQIVATVVRFTDFAYWQHPTLTLATTLLQYLEPHKQWKANCLRPIGHTQMRRGEYKSAIETLTAAARLYLEVGDPSSAAWCSCSAADAYQLLGQYSHAEKLIEEARVVYSELGIQLKEAGCRMNLGELARRKNEYSAAVEHLTAAHRVFNSFGRAFHAAQCLESLGAVHLDLDNLDLAAAELESSRLAFIALGDHIQVAQSTRLLGSVRRSQGDFGVSEKLLTDAELISTTYGHSHGVAECARELGYLRSDENRRSEAVAYFKRACHIYDTLGLEEGVGDCLHCIEMLESTDC